MNRAARRLNKIESPRRSYTEAQFQAEVQKQADIMFNAMKAELFSRFMYVSCLSLHDEFDFGEIRLQRFVEKMQLTLACLNEDRLSLDDIKKLMTEKYDFEFITSYKGGQYEHKA